METNVGNLIYVDEVDVTKQNLNHCSETRTENSQILSEEWEDPLDLVHPPKTHSRDEISSSKEISDVNPKDRAIDLPSSDTDQGGEDEPHAAFQDRFWWIFFLSTMLLATAAILYSLGFGDLSVLERQQGQAGVVGDGLLQISRLKGEFFLGIPLLCVLVGFISDRCARLSPYFAITFTVSATSLISIVTACFIFFIQVLIWSYDCVAAHIHPPSPIYVLFKSLPVASAFASNCFLPIRAFSGARTTTSSPLSPPPPTPPPPPPPRAPP